MEIAEFVRTGEKMHVPRSVISGQFTERVNRYVSMPEFLMISVDLKPGALYRLTGISFSEFTNKYIDAENVFTKDINGVNERLCNAKGYAEMIEIIEAFLITLIKKNNKETIAVDHLLPTLITTSPDISIDNLAKKAFLCTRQLDRKFNERVGVSPKTFLRISRFNQSYWMRLKNPDLTWFTIAIYCGYCDYQHLVKDYKEFANATPNEFFNEERKAPGRMLGLTK
jgi:AraC-like DNA-binding protein